MSASRDRTMPIKVSIVDDDEGIRSSLVTLIRRAPALKLLGDYADAETALRELPRQEPDVVLMDINLPGMDGVECVRQLKATLPRLQVLMLTVYEDSDSLFKSLRAGASGYLLKRTASARLLEAIQDVRRRLTDDAATGAPGGAVFFRTTARGCVTVCIDGGRAGISRSTGQRLHLQGDRGPNENHD